MTIIGVTVSPTLITEQL